MLGQKIGSYEILEEIGRGGMATVYRAYQASVNRFVAIKIIQSGILLDPTNIERFAREAQLIAQLEHAHILPVYDFDGNHKPPYIVMRYLPTGTLSNIIERVALPIGEVLHLFRQIASAIDYSHRQGVVHRDIKPSNIMVDAEGNVFLTDFGVARLVSAKTALTASGVTIGTPAYMAPEQGLGHDVDGRADIYALAVILYELLAGKMPYEAETPIATIYKHIHDSIPNILNNNPDLPIEMQEFFEKALAKIPEDRFQTAAELVTAFEEAIGEDVNTRPVILKKTATDTIRERSERRENTAPTDNETAEQTFNLAGERQNGASNNLVKRFLSLAGLLLILMIAAGLYWMSQQNDDSSNAEQTQQVENTTPARESTTTAQSQVTNTSEAMTAIALFNSSATVTALTPAPTKTATYTLSADDAVDTLEARETATEAIILTQTATQWTVTPSYTPSDTPTPTFTADWTQTVNAVRTERAWERATEITWTPTTTLTYTPSFTATDTFTPTETPTLSPFERAFISVKNNSDWQPYSEVIDGVEMVLVPAGCFLMGSTDEQLDYAEDLGAERDWYVNEQPVQQICFEAPFWIDKYEVTNADFGSSGCPDWSSRPDQPRNCVGWVEVRDHCAARDARVPTEAEWEYAARGPESWIYPWGNEFIAPNVVYVGNSSQPASVGSKPAGVSWVGALNMAGNVIEWTSSIYQDYPYTDEIRDRTDMNFQVLRGGSFGSAPYQLRSTIRLQSIPTINAVGVGFRCARSID